MNKPARSFTRKPELPPVNAALENPPVASLEKAAVRKLRHQPPRSRFWKSLAALWRRRTTVIAVFAAVAIAANLILRFGFHMSPGAYQIPLLATLALGGIPLVYELLKKLFRREFGSDLLAGISIITSVLLGEYLAGSIVVLMLSGGEALELSRTPWPSNRLPLAAPRFSTRQGR